MKTHPGTNIPIDRKNNEQNARHFGIEPPPGTFSNVAAQTEQRDGWKSSWPTQKTLNIPSGWTEQRDTHTPAHDCKLSLDNQRKGKHLIGCCPTPAQPKPSPLPTERDDWTREYKKLLDKNDALTAHAQRLAEALLDVTTAAEIVYGCEAPEDSDIERSPVRGAHLKHMLNCFKKAHKTLAAWKGAQK